MDYCQSNPCHPNATCVSHSDSFTCTCKTGFTGSGLECTGTNKKRLSLVVFRLFDLRKADKIIINSVGQKYDIDSISDIDECVYQQCDVNAICNNTFGSFSCSCDSGYMGDGMNCTGEIWNGGQRNYSLRSICIKCIVGLYL